MNHFLNTALALPLGFGLGVFFFGGLWWTVRKTVTGAAPSLFVISFIVRFGTVSIVLVAFRDDWKALLLLLAGFLAARVTVVRKISTHLKAL